MISGSRVGKILRLPNVSDFIDPSQVGYLVFLQKCSGIMNIFVNVYMRISGTSSKILDHEGTREMRASTSITPNFLRP